MNQYYQHEAFLLVSNDGTTSYSTACVDELSLMEVETCTKSAGERSGRLRYVADVKLGMLRLHNSYVTYFEVPDLPINLKLRQPISSSSCKDPSRNYILIETQSAENVTVRDDGADSSKERTTVQRARAALERSKSLSHPESSENKLTRRRSVGFTEPSDRERSGGTRCEPIRRHRLKVVSEQMEQSLNKWSQQPAPRSRNLTVGGGRVVLNDIDEETEEDKTGNVAEKIKELKDYARFRVTFGAHSSGSFSIRLSLIMDADSAEDVGGIIDVCVHGNVLDHKSGKPMLRHNVFELSKGNVQTSDTETDW